MQVTINILTGCLKVYMAPMKKMLAPKNFGQIKNNKKN